MNSGGLVPDSLVIKMVVSEISKLGGKNILFDGFPRTMGQAQELEKAVKIDIALNLEVPNEEIVSRISGRWTHPGSGRVYAYDYNPPKVEGKDDVTGEPLIQRDDDKPEAVRKRLEAYDKMTAPLVNHYNAQGILTSSAGAKSPELVQAGRRSDAIYSELKPVLNKAHGKN
jgi:nucleoside-triphosphate--adenylate kinase